MKQNIQFKCLNPIIKKHCPILPAKKCIPDWYKDLSLYTENLSSCPVMRRVENNVKPIYTVKACPPIFDYLNSGYIIPWTREVVFRESFASLSDDPNNKSFEFYCRFNDTFTGANDDTYIKSHKPNRMPILNTHFFTVSCDWTIKTPSGYSTLFFQPFYHFEKRYAMLPAIVDTDKYHSPDFVGYILQNQFTVQPNEPLICAFPFKRDHFVSSIDDEDEKNPTYHRNMIYKLFFEKRYKILAWDKKKYD